MHELLKEIRHCKLCKPYIPFEPKPVLTASQESKICIIGQAPGIKVHESGIPWNDQSGDTLRTWLGISRNLFYDTSQIAIVPMGFCYPGKGPSGDLPPRPECAPTWHARILENMPALKLSLFVGKYAQNYYLKNASGENLTKTVKNYKTFLPKFFPLPHPSPRNRFWLKQNPWFSEILIPDLQSIIRSILRGE